MIDATVSRILALKYRVHPMQLKYLASEYDINGESMHDIVRIRYENRPLT